MDIKLNSEKIKKIIHKYISDDSYDFELHIIEDIVIENSDYNATFSDEEKNVAYLQGLKIFADCLKEYTKHELEIYKDNS